MISSVLARHARARTVAGREQGFAMITAILLIVMVGALSVAFAGVLLSETKPTQAVRKTTGTLNAAQSGFEVALHQLRNATDSDGNGIRTKLPCKMTDSETGLGTKMPGLVGPAAGSYAYAVYVRYYFTDPAKLTTAELQSKVIKCSSDGGPAAVPQFAYLQTSGSGAAIPGSSAGQGTRNLHTTYQFRTSNLNVAGGRLGENTTSLCMDAGTAPAVGSKILVKTCQARGTVSQSWAYRPDLTLYYVPSGSPGLCVSGGSNAAETALTLQTCITASTTYPYVSTAAQQQEFSFDDNGKFEGGASGGDVNGLCIAPTSTTPSSGDQLYIRTCTGGGFDYMTWNPDKQVGAGPAGEQTQQLVNYEEFGRCLDVTSKQLALQYLIDYPCKQAPNASNISWNQRWTYGSDGAGYKAISSATPSGKYCLQDASPKSPTGINLVYAAPCTGSVAQRWTKTGELTGNYSSSYQIVNNAGLCLSLGTPDTSSTYNAQWSRIVAETCDGSLKQKWNAPANFIDSRVQNTTEDKGGS